MIAAVKVSTVAALAMMWAGAVQAQNAITAEAPVVGGNAASARERALADAFRQVVERSFAAIVAESGSPPQPLPPALAQLHASLFGRARRFVRSYRVLEQVETGGVLRLQVVAEVDESLLRREIDRLRPPATAAPPSVWAFTAGGTPDEAVRALVHLLREAGLKTETGSFPDEAAARQAAAKNGAAAALWVSASVSVEGPVRGTSKSAVTCRVTARILGGTGAAPIDRSTELRAFGDTESSARGDCLLRAAGELGREVMAVSSSAAGGGGRAITLELDLVEPAALSPVLQALRKMAAVSAAEVRRVSVGRAELRVTSTLTAGPLVAALARTGSGEVVLVPTETGSDRATLQVRLAGAAASSP